MPSLWAIHTYTLQRRCQNQPSTPTIKKPIGTSNVCVRFEPYFCRLKMGNEVEGIKIKLKVLDFKLLVTYFSSNEAFQGVKLTSDTTIKTSSTRISDQ